MPRQHGLNYFPDGCMAFPDAEPNLRILLAAGVSTWLLEGADLRSLSPVAEVLKHGPAGSFDNGYAGIGAAMLANGPAQVADALSRRGSGRDERHPWRHSGFLLLRRTGHFAR